MSGKIKEWNSTLFHFLSIVDPSSTDKNRSFFFSVLICEIAIPATQENDHVNVITQITYKTNMKFQ